MDGKRPVLNINIEIKNLPEETNKVLNMLAKISGAPKTNVIRAALIEYAANHRDEIMQFVSTIQRSAKEAVDQ